LGEGKLSRCTAGRGMIRGPTVASTPTVESPQDHGVLGVVLGTFVLRGTVGTFLFFFSSHEHVFDPVRFTFYCDAGPRMEGNRAVLDGARIIYSLDYV